MKYIPLKKQPNVSRSSFEVSAPSMELDGRGYPHIVWTENKIGKTEINYSYWDGLKWSYRGVPKVADIVITSKHNALTLNSNESPLIVFVREKSTHVLTIASYNTKWNNNELPVDYTVGWIGIAYFGDYNVGQSSSSSSSMGSSSSSSSFDDSTSSSSSYDDKGIVVVAYDSTSSMLKIYLVSDDAWVLIGTKSVEINDPQSLRISIFETQLGIVYTESDVVKYNFFDIEDVTWAFISFSDIGSITGSIIDVDMLIYKYLGATYLSVGCLSNTSSVSYVSNTICSYTGIETYYEIEANSYDLSIPADYVVGNTSVAVTVNGNNIYQLVTGGGSKTYSGIGSPVALTWDDGTIVSLDCCGDDLIPLSMVMGFSSFSGNTKIAVQSDSYDIYFLEAETDSKTLTTPDVTILNNQEVLNTQYSDGELSGNRINNTYDGRCGGILKDSKGYIAIVDSSI